RHVTSTPMLAPQKGVGSLWRRSLLQHRWPSSAIDSRPHRFTKPIPHVQPKCLQSTHRQPAAGPLSYAKDSQRRPAVSTACSGAAACLSLKRLQNQSPPAPLVRATGTWPLMFVPLGTPKEELDTPALLIDLDRFEANVAEAAALCRQYGVAWRPHA